MQDVRMFRKGIALQSNWALCAGNQLVFLSKMYSLVLMTIRFRQTRCFPPSSPLQTRRSRGYCFIYFDSLKSAIRAVEASSNLRIDSRYVRVDYSITTRARSPGAYRDDIKTGYGSRIIRVRSPSPSRRKYMPIYAVMTFFFQSIGLVVTIYNFCIFLSLFPFHSLFTKAIIVDCYRYELFRSNIQQKKHVRFELLRHLSPPHIIKSTWKNSISIFPQSHGCKCTHTNIHQTNRLNFSNVIPMRSVNLKRIIYVNEIEIT